MQPPPLLSKRDHCAILQHVYVYDIKSQFTVMDRLIGVAGR